MVARRTARTSITIQKVVVMTAMIRQLHGPLLPVQILIEFNVEGPDTHLLP